MPRGAALAVALALMSVPAVADGDPDAGEVLFARCAACHDIEAGRISRVGPPLGGIVGNTAGMSSGFDYSTAMAEAGAGGLVWTEETLDAFLADPRNFVRGARMAFPGIADAGARADIIAYLATLEHTAGTD